MNVLEFIDRKVELETLKKIADERGPRIVFVYGRRRVGKTYLLTRFLRDVRGKYIYFNSNNRAEVISILERESNISGGVEEMLRNLLKDSTVVFDEAQRAVDALPELPGIIQRFFDLGMNFMLVLSGSSVSLMRKLMKSQLTGRKRAAMHIKPFGFEHSLELLDRDFEEAMKFYAVVGGTPYYLRIAREKKSLNELFSEFFPTIGRFYEEPELILASEELESLNYFSVLLKIALGKTSFSQLAGSLNLKTSVLNFFLKTLINRLDVVKREESLIGEARPVYRISDNFFRFYFTFIFPNMGYLEAHNFEPVLGEIKGNFKYYFSKVFEDIALEALQIAFPGYKTGRIWGNFGKEKIHVEIDAAALSPDGKELVVAEVKWQDKKIGRDELNELIEKASLLGFDGRIKYLLIGKKVAEIDEEDVEVWDLRRLEEIFKGG